MNTCAVTNSGRDYAAKLLHCVAGVRGAMHIQNAMTVCTPAVRMRPFTPLHLWQRLYVILVKVHQRR